MGILMSLLLLLVPSYVFTAQPFSPHHTTAGHASLVVAHVSPRRPWVGPPGRVPRAHPSGPSIRRPFSLRLPRVLPRDLRRAGSSARLEATDAADGHTRVCAGRCAGVRRRKTEARREPAGGGGGRGRGRGDGGEDGSGGGVRGWRSSSRAPGAERGGRERSVRRRRVGIRRVRWHRRA